jgi:DNA polymerase III epsilon subunit-like protein
MNKILVLDTETTGLIPKMNFTKNINDINIENLNNCPYILQFSYIYYDTINNNFIKCEDKYIKIPENIEISKDNSKIHGITKEIIKEKGILIESILIDFMLIYQNSNKIIGHNILFDLNMIFIELLRLIIKTSNNETAKHNKWIDYYHVLINDVYDKSSMKIYCTMKTTKQICNLLITNKNGKISLKYPKLIELYYYLFNKKPENFHNSLIDCLSCLRCYIKIIYDDDIFVNIILFNQEQEKEQHQLIYSFLKSHY